MKQTRVSEFRHVATIYTAVEVDDGLGGVDTDETILCRSRAAIWPVSAKEIRQNMRDDVTITHNIRIRYRSGLDNAMKIIFRGRTFEIKGMINPDERNRYIDMVCEEKAA